jgi:AcrR family transcriptional regulator
MARPKESERIDVKGLAITTAKRLFSDLGYSNVTMRRIADEIGVTPGTIYLYYKNKAEILFEIHNEGFRLLHERRSRMLADGSSDPIEKLRIGGLNYIAFALENPELYELMFFLREPRDYLKASKRERRKEEGPLVDYSIRSYENLRQTIVECQAEGYYPDLNPDMLAFFHWALVHGLSSLAILDRVPFPKTPTKELADGAIDLIMRMIQDTKEPENGD